MYENIKNIKNRKNESETPTKYLNTILAFQVRSGLPVLYIIHFVTVSVRIPNPASMKQLLYLWLKKKQFRTKILLLCNIYEFIQNRAKNNYYLPLHFSKRLDVLTSLQLSQLKKIKCKMGPKWLASYHLQYAAFTLRQQFLPFFFVKSWSNFTPNGSFKICLSWPFQSTPYMLNLMKFWLRYLRLKTIDIFQKLISFHLFHCQFSPLFLHWI